MNIAAIIAFLTSLFKFPDSVKSLLQYIVAKFSKTPSQQIDEANKKIDQGLDEKQNGGRPGDI